SGNSLRPWGVISTRPPPALPAPSTFASCSWARCMFSCIFCACCMSCAMFPRMSVRLFVEGADGIRDQRRAVALHHLLHARIGNERGFGGDLARVAFSGAALMQ